MVDHYVTGSVSRVSEEAPVPIIHVAGERWTPGAAANVAANIVALGGKAMLVGGVGEDAAAVTLADSIARSGEVETHLVADAGRPTSIKTRYMGGQHQIVRVDREQPTAVSAAAEGKLIAAIEALAPRCNAIVLSDYAKGALTPRVIQAAIAAARKTGAPVVVDPKRTDWKIYEGASVITPNRKELQLAAHAPCVTDADCNVAAGIAIKSTGAAILLTRPEHGMSLFREGEAPLHLAAKA